MAEKIKKFFAKKKADTRFKLAGPGHKLSESSTTVVGPSKKKNDYVPSKVEPSEAAKQAAEAALLRVSSLQKKDNAFNTSLAAIQAKVRKELEAEKKSELASELAAKPIETELEVSSHLAVKGRSNMLILLKTYINIFVFTVILAWHIVFLHITNKFFV